MGVDVDRPLTTDDIMRLGVEAGMRVDAMQEFPDQVDIDNAVQALGMRAVELAYSQPVIPEGVDG